MSETAPNDNGERRPCTPGSPMPAGATGRWSHEDVEEVADYGDTRRMRCRSCEKSWVEELPQ